MSDPIYIKLRYRGRLNNPADVHQLILETEDICRINDWSFHVWDEDWRKELNLSHSFSGEALKFEGHAPLKGISFSVENSETVWLTFSPDGTLNSLMTLTDPTFTGDDEYFPWQRVKTGFDGAKTHLALCKLFRHLAHRYFEVFEVMDESGYWQHGDDDRLTVWMDDLQREHQQFEDEMAVIEADESLTPEQKRVMFYRLIRDFGEKFRVGG